MRLFAKGAYPILYLKKEIIMATITATGSGTTNNNTGKVLQGGNIAGSKFTSLTLGTTADDARKHGLPTVSATLGNQAAISGRGFAYIAGGQYIIRSFSTKIAGVTDNTFRCPGHPSTAITPKFAKLETVKTGFLKSSSWTSVGKELPTYTHTTSAQTVAMGADTGATTAQRLTYLTGSNVPVTTVRDYD